MKKGLIATIVIFVVIIGGAVLLSNKNQQVKGDSSTDIRNTNADVQLPVNPEYYWGETCPHCANVAEFLEGWEYTDEANINKFEVYNDRDNAVKLQNRAKDCGLNSGNVGVPFMFTPGGECIVGDVPIIEYLQNTYGE